MDNHYLSNTMRYMSPISYYTQKIVPVMTLQYYVWLLDVSLRRHDDQSVLEIKKHIKAICNDMLHWEFNYLITQSIETVLFVHNDGAVNKYLFPRHTRQLNIPRVSYGGRGLQTLYMWESV